MFDNILEKPKEIPESDYGVFVVFSDHTSGLIEWAIKMRTKGLVNHVMLSINQGKFVSQGNTYSEVTMDRYLKKGSRLYFFKLNSFNLIQIDAIKQHIKRKLALPWYKKMYDWIGILGQALGIKNINVNGLNYCSEDVAMAIRSCLPFSSQNTNVDLFTFIHNIPKHEHPQGLFDYFCKFPQFMEKYGYHEVS